MLSKDLLRESLRHLFQPATMPKGQVPDAVMQWASSYAKYANLAMAGGTILASPLIPVPMSGPFFQAIDSSFRTMWLAAKWIGPGLAGSTLATPSLIPILLQNSQRLMQSRDPGLALSLIVEALHTYTLSVTVTVVTATGAVAVVPIV